MPKDYKEEAKKNWNARKYAWGQYYQIRNELFDLNTWIYNELNNSNNTEIDTNTETEDYLNNFIRDLYKKAKECVECPICLEAISSEDLYTTNCGHNYHNGCYEQLKQSSEDGKTINCAVCRKKIYIKQNQ